MGHLVLGWPFNPSMDVPVTSQRCLECKGDRRQICPSGPIDASVMLIGEGPGHNEEKEGVPFVGVSGREQDHTYFSLAGLERKDVFVTNCVQCRCERGGVDARPSEKLVSACAENHLKNEILSVYPRIIILAGATACSLVGVDLEYEHGLPFYYNGDRMWGWKGWVVPMYHPAAGLRETRFMIPLLQDWENFGYWLLELWAPPVAPDTSNLDYRLIEFPEELYRYDLSRLSVDTESDEGVPYSIQCSPRSGQAFMVLAANRQAIQRLADKVSDSHATFHYAVHDLDECDRMGIHFGAFDDTMQQIYHLAGVLPQALKVAVYRTLGFRMTTYQDVVTPASKKALDGWLGEAFAHVVTKMRPCIEHKKGKGCPACGKNHRADKTESKTHEAEAVLRRVMDRLNSDYDPWKMPTWSKGEKKVRLIGRDWLPEIEVAVGRMPRQSIVHAPMERQILYACGDADWTGRLAQWLQKERERIVMEEWRSNFGRSAYGKMPS